MAKKKELASSAALLIHSEFLYRRAPQQVPPVPKTDSPAEICPLHPHRRVGADGAWQDLSLLLALRVDHGAPG